jgi:hypothetical protein
VEEQMEVETWDQPARELREHVRQVAEVLGCTGEAYVVDAEEPMSAYLPLDQHLYGFPDRDAALLWDVEHGWSAVVEDPEEPLVVAYLGARRPDPTACAAFVTGLVAGSGCGGGRDLAR